MEKQYKIKSRSSLYNIHVSIVEANSTNQKRETMILCHGLGSNKDGYLNFYKNVSEELSKNGISTVRFDFVGHGESDRPSTEFTVASQIDDLISVYNWVTDKSPENEISLFGTSFGAFPCLYLSQLTKEIRKVNLLAPVLDYQKTFIDPSTEWAINTFSDLEQRAILNDEKIGISDEFSMGRKLAFEISTISIDDRFFNLNHVSLRIMHGTNDGMVPFKISKEITSKFQHFDFFEFENMEHGFTDKGDLTGAHPNTIRNFNRIIEILSK